MSKLFKTKITETTPITLKAKVETPTASRQNAKSSQTSNASQTNFAKEGMIRKKIKVSQSKSKSRKKTDPVTTEIIRNSVVAITEEMKANLMRTAYSMIIYEAQDFTVGLFDAKGETISIGIGLPMFTRGMSDVIKAMLGHFQTKELSSGDVLITNDAYLTGSHLNHITLAVPIFYQKKLVGFTGCMAHWADIGGALNIVTRDIYSEGLQLPILKMYSAGKMNKDVYDIIRMNVRIAERAIGDLNAQTAAVNRGAKRYIELMQRYSAPVVLDAIDRIMDQSEKMARDQVSKIPDGTYTAESYMDDDAVDLGVRVPIRVKVIVKGDEMTVDLSEVSAQVKGFYNSGEAAGVACCQVAFKCITSARDKPINDGSFRPLKIILPKGTVVSAVKPAPMQRWMTYPMTVVDTIIKALSSAIPDQVIAGHHADLMMAMSNGRNPYDENKFFLLVGGLTGGGWGAKHGSDGRSATICINDGDTHNAPVEQVEAKYPVVIEKYSLREDSGGAGEWQGGLGTEKAVRALSDFNFNAQVERVYCRPWGLFNGHPGMGNQVAVRNIDGKEIIYPTGKVHGRILKTDEAYFLRSGGGGGFGSPLERSIEKVISDLKEGYISKNKAKYCYGIVFSNNEFGVDVEKTLNKRAFMRDKGHLAWSIKQNEMNTLEPGLSANHEVTGKFSISNNSSEDGAYFTESQLFNLRCCF
jgi:N-methylhydantoinase B